MRNELIIYVSIIVAALILSVLNVINDVRALQAENHNGRRFFAKFREGDEVSSLRRLAPLALAFLIMAKDKWGVYALIAVPVVLLLIIVYELVKKRKDKAEALDRRSKKVLIIAPLMIVILLSLVVGIGGCTAQALLVAAVLTLFAAFCTPVFTIAANWLVPKKDKEEDKQ